MTNIMGTTELYFSANRTCTEWMVDNTNLLVQVTRSVKGSYIQNYNKILKCPFISQQCMQVACMYVILCHEVVNNTGTMGVVGSR